MSKNSFNMEENNVPVIVNFQDYHIVSLFFFFFFEILPSSVLLKKYVHEIKHSNKTEPKPLHGSTYPKS